MENKEYTELLDDLNKLQKEEIIDIVSEFYHTIDKQIKKNKKNVTYMGKLHGNIKRTLLDNLRFMVKLKIEK